MKIPEELFGLNIIMPLLPDDTVFCGGKVLSAAHIRISNL